MPQVADLGSKRLIGLRPGQWVKWVTGRDDVVAEELLSADYQWVGRSDDAVIRAYCPEVGQFAVPIEVQLRPQERMPWRMFGYSGLSAEKTELPVYPVVVNLLPPKQDMAIPAAYDCECLGLRGHQDYRVIDMWEVDSDLAFREELRGFLPFVPLMRGGGTEERVLQARQELHGDEDLIPMEPLLAFFASYLLGTAFVDEMRGWKMDLIAESPLFKEMMRQAEERAALERARADVLQNLDAHFGAVPEGVAEKIQRVSDMKRLESLLRLAVTTQSLDEFARAAGV